MFTYLSLFFKSRNLDNSKNVIIFTSLIVSKLFFSCVALFTGLNSVHFYKYFGSKKLPLPDQACLFTFNFAKSFNDSSLNPELLHW